jgi:Na+-translocating membrane potential-generating system (MpsC)
MEEDICREILAIHRASYCERAGRGVAHLVHDTVVVMHEGDDIALLPGEELLIDCGQGETVCRVRDTFQETIEPTFKAAVERATGRRVVGFGSCTRLDEPRFSMEVFRLEPN